MLRSGERDAVESISIKINYNPREFSRYDNKHVNNLAVLVMSAVVSPRLGLQGTLLKT